MPTDRYTDELKEIYSTARTDVNVIHTLEFTHPASVTENDKLDVVFVLDTSGSMGGQIELIKTSLEALLNNLLVEFALVRFGLVSYGQSSNSGQPIFQVDLTTDPQALIDVLDTLVASGSQEPVYDAIGMAINSMTWNNDLTVTRAIYVITDEDGEDDGNTLTEEEVSTLLDSNNYILHQSFRDYTPPDPISKALVRFMVQTGGKYIDDSQSTIDFVEDATEAFKTRRIIDSNIQPYYLVQAVEDIDLPLELGEDPVTFEAVGFNFQLPGQNDQGLQELSIEFDNVDRRLGDFVTAVSKYNAPAIVRYRPYISSDLSEPQMSPPLKLTLTDVKMTEEKVTGRATFADIVNLKFLTQNYTRRRFPSLGNT